MAIDIHYVAHQVPAQQGVNEGGQMTIDEILHKLYDEGRFEGDHREIHPDRIAQAKASLAEEVGRLKVVRTYSERELGRNNGIDDVLKMMRGE